MSKEKNWQEQIAEQAARIDSTLRATTATHFGVLDTRFLNQSISTLSTEPPICVNQEESLAEIHQGSSTVLLKLNCYTFAPMKGLHKPNVTATSPFF